jgi:hypothetical protein
LDSSTQPPASSSHRLRTAVRILDQRWKYQRHCPGKAKQFVLAHQSVNTTVVDVELSRQTPELDGIAATRDNEPHVDTSRAQMPAERRRMFL